MANEYPQREAFKGAITRYRAEKGLRLTEVAPLLGLGYETLRGYLYGKGRPSLDVLQKLSALTGQPITDFIDDPGSAPSQELAEGSEIDRFMAKTMGSNLAKMTPEQKLAAFEAWKAIARGFGVS